jgi:hypothetical protein
VLARARARLRAALAPLIRARSPVFTPLVCPPVCVRVRVHAETALEDDLMGLGIAGSTDASASRQFEESFM